MTEISDFQTKLERFRNEYQELRNKLGVIFCYNPKKFNKLKIPKIEYVLFQEWFYCPKKDFRTFLSEYKQIRRRFSKKG